MHKFFTLPLTIVVVILLLKPFGVDGWLLAQVGLNESYRVRHLSMHFSRVFLSINVESQTFPTLIEAQWPVSYLPLRAAVFPHRELHANGDHSDCTRIQQARWSQVDSLSRLWVMDMGWQEAGTVICPPKLLVFDLIRRNAEVLRIDCGKYIEPNDAKLLVVKLGPTPTACNDSFEKFIYFILADDSHIFAYDILEQSWHRRKLISRKYSNINETFPIKPVDLAFSRQHELIICDEDGAIYTYPNALMLDSDEAINESGLYTDNSNALMGVLEMELLGSLLGPSIGMIIDQLGALFYAVAKFGAVVRCEYKKNLTAEGNEIIFMTSKNINQLFFGEDGSVWLLTDRSLQPKDHCLPGF